MSETNEQQAEQQPPAPAAGADKPPQGEKVFVPFFNEDYQFRLGGLGDLGIAYRLAAIFIFMLLAAGMMYVGAWWWVGTHPLAQNH